MYRQIRVHPADAILQQILWRWSPDQPILSYTLDTVTYGTACAPYLATKSLQQLAINHLDEYPVAANTVLKSFYVDDGMSGDDTIEKTRSLQQDLIELLKRGGFHLRKWTANDERLLQHIPEADRETSETVMFQEDNIIKTLGLHRNTRSDEFCFKVQLDTTTTRATKRSLLSDVSKLFDPLGWLAPCTVKAKMLFQRLWLTGLQWDDELDDDTNNEWTTLRNQLLECESIKIPRWLNTMSNSNFTIHGFSDSSDKAYAAVIYIRVGELNQLGSIALLGAKTRVAPIKTVSTPRLELCGAVLLTRLAVMVQQILEVPTEKFHFWVDSTVVLAWIRGLPSRWKTFVANRVAEIHTHFGPHQWQHVVSAQNPADIGSRGLMPAELCNRDLWWLGPSWLSNPQDQWPNNENQFSTSLEEKRMKVCAAFAQPQTNEFLEKYSDITKLIRITVYVMRFIRNSKNSSQQRRCLTRVHTRSQPRLKLLFWPITVHEMDAALVQWIRIVQRSAFPDEYAALTKKENVSLKSKLATLNPNLTSNHIIVVGGRLSNHHETYASRHPIILPYNNHFTSLIIKQIHLDTLHGGIQLTLNVMRENYWLLNGRRAIKQHIRKCITCFKQKTGTEHQLMGDLPAFRVNPSFPFQNTGIDFAGPLLVRASTRRNAQRDKAYIAVFVCMATKACHLELVTDLTTGTFLDALKRFVARRGIPNNIYSDNGTNFQGASNELPRLLFDAQTDESQFVINSLANNKIQWHFIPPGAPNHGGIWERCVRSVKHHLKRILGNACLTFHETTTVLTQIEAALNSRPITPLTDDVEDFVALTPGHFLIGRSLSTVPTPNLTSINENRLGRWQLTQQLYQHFWHRWSAEYLSTLQTRNKWMLKRSDLCKNMMVLLRDDRTAPSKWMLGRIIQTHPGADGHVRVVTVKFEHSMFKRPITKIAVLPIEDNSNRALLDGAEHVEDCN